MPKPTMISAVTDAAAAEANIAEANTAVTNTAGADLVLDEATESDAEPSPTADRPLIGRSLAELTAWIQEQGQPAYRGKQLHQWLYERQARSLAEITVFPQRWRSQMAEQEQTGQLEVGRSQVHFRSVAADGTVKFLLRLRDGHIIETVGMPSTKRLTVCVSSQVGCPMACDFCATGKGGFQRNLTAAEIVDQVLTVQADFGDRVSNLVFMGMGEPLLNTQAVVQAIQCLNQEVGIGQRGMTVSTVGIPGRIRQLAELGTQDGRTPQFTLAVSLHASNQELRQKLIPTARKYPMEALLQECREYLLITGRRVSFEYILLAGLNDRPQHAEELARHLRGFQSHVNLIPYNPIAEVDYKRPRRESVEAFAQRLRDRYITTSVRYSRGLEADAACGQLRARKA